MSSDIAYMPQEIDIATRTFPAGVAGLMPPYDEIPKEFKRNRNKWVQFQVDWFFRGLKSYKVTPKDGIDARKAMMHLGTIQGSWEPAHEHKEAAVAYLASLWFEDVEYEAYELQSL